MKLFKFGFMAAVCAMMASCSSDEPVINTPENGGQTESGYATFAINLPTVSGTGSRAVTDEQGTEQEYKVINGTVYIFQKATAEGDARFVCSAELYGMDWTAGAPGEITTTGKAVAQLQNIDKQNANVQYGAMVLLNVPTNLVKPSTNQTLKNWMEKENYSMTISNNGQTFITMSSAPRYVGSNMTPVILTDVNKDMIFQTESQATASGSPAAEIFVQRNVAKVSLATNYKTTIEGGQYAGDKVQIKAWGLDITNKKSFAFQNVNGLSDSYADIWKGGGALNRFFGNGTKFQRVFWAKDPNYDKDITTLDQVKGSFNVISDVTENPTCVYAMENTFDINHQMQGQTTRVVIKADYTPQGFSAGETFYKIGSVNTLWNAANLKAQIENTAKTVLNSANVSVDIAGIAQAGHYSLKDVTIKNNGSDLAAAELKTVAERLGLTDENAKEIATYAGGHSYYIARVKHFGDADCPWTVGDPTYGGNNEKYLGRYGMVRNNWYEVSVNSISNPGSPVVPEVNPTTPDDESAYFISVSVNILSWAKRVQNADL